MYVFLAQIPLDRFRTRPPSFSAEMPPTIRTLESLAHRTPWESLVLFGEERIGGMKDHEEKRTAALNIRAHSLG